MRFCLVTDLGGAVGRRVELVHPPPIATTCLSGCLPYVLHGWGGGGGWSSVFLSLLDYGLQLQHDTFCISILEHKVHKIRSMCVCFLMEEWKCRKRLQDDIDMPWWPTTECTCGVLGTVILFVESIQVLEWQVILALRIHHCMTFTPCHV
jgi:hypothetical protein